MIIVGIQKDSSFGKCYRCVLLSSYYGGMCSFKNRGECGDINLGEWQYLYTRERLAGDIFLSFLVTTLYNKVDLPHDI